MSLIATVSMYRIHTFTSGFPPLIGCTPSSLTRQTLCSLQGPFSTRSLTSFSRCALHNLVSVSVLGGGRSSLCCCIIRFQVREHYKFLCFSSPWIRQSLPSLFTAVSSTNASLMLQMSSPTTFNKLGSHIMLLKTGLNWQSGNLVSIDAINELCRSRQGI